MALYVLLSLMQYTFLFKMDVLRVTQVVQLFLYLRLKYYEAKIQMLSVFSWNLVQPRNVRMTYFVIFKRLQYDALCSFTEIASCCDCSALRKKTEKFMLQK